MTLFNAMTAFAMVLLLGVGLVTYSVSVFLLVSASKPTSQKGPNG